MYKKIGDLFEDVTGLKPQTDAQAEAFAAKMIPYFARLNKNLPEIIIKRYAIGRHLGLTFDQIGDDLEMSGARVRQILQKGILYWKYDRHRPTSDEVKRQ